MANTKSAKKALRSSKRKYEINSARKWKIKNALKELRRVLVSDPTNHQNALSEVYSQLDKAAKTNIIHSNKASRRKSRIAQLVAKTLANKQES